MTGRASQRKGREFETAVVSLLSSIFGVDKVRRGLQYRDGADCPDVIAPWLWIECKRARLTNPRAALRQATADARGSGMVPVAICKDDGQRSHVTIDLADFLDILTELHVLKSQFACDARPASPDAPTNGGSDVGH